MANVEHSILTGTDLHEPKGVAAAVANRVYLSDGAASGSWTTIPTAAIDAAGVKVFQSELLHISNRQTSGTAGGSISSSGAWNTLTLNTEVTDDATLGSLASNQVTLAAGTYFLQGWATYHTNINSPDSATIAKIRLRNMTASTTLLVGQSLQLDVTIGAGTNIDIQQMVPISGRFTLGVSSALEFQMYTNDTSSQGQGNPASTGETEVYSDYLIWKLT